MWQRGSLGTAGFQSTLPLRGATASREKSPCGTPYFNPRSPCGERPQRISRFWRALNISIHAPLAGSDVQPSAAAYPRGSISIHAPLAGSDPVGSVAPESNPDFNPRSPCGERPERHRLWPCERVISIHAPLAGSDLHRGLCGGRQAISIHAPLAGSDAVRRDDLPHPCGFQSTLPLRGATAASFSWFSGRLDFNPRSPCGERHGLKPAVHVAIEFQSTLPLRGATSEAPYIAAQDEFQSTLPLRGATGNTRRIDKWIGISIHAPLAGSD